MTFKQEFLQSFQDSIKPPFTGSIEAWAYDNVVLPAGIYSVPGRFDTSRSRFLIQPFQSIRDHRVRQVNIMGGVQIGKSIILEVSLLFFMKHYPGMVLYLLNTGQASNILCDTRINPLIRSIPSIRDLLPTDKTELKKRLIKIPGSTVEFGEASPSCLHSRTCRFLFCDEVWEYPELLSQAKSRTDAYSTTRKIIFCGQAGNEHDAWHDEFLKGQVFEWTWLCPHCSKYQPYLLSDTIEGRTGDDKWAGMIYSPDVLDASGKKDIPKTAAQVRFVCKHCGGSVKEEDRSLLNKTGKYEMVKDGDPTIHSYHYPTFAGLSVPWKNVAQDYLYAKEAQHEGGDLTRLEQFYKQKLAEPWGNWKGWTNNNDIEVGNYDVNSPFPDSGSYMKFLTADVQDSLREFYVTIFAWQKGTKHAKQLYRGIVDTPEEIEDLRLQYGVKNQHVALDCGSWKDPVYEVCVNHGHVGINKKGEKEWMCWRAFMGRFNDNGYKHKVKVNGKEEDVYKPYSPPTIGKPNKSNKTCRVFRWSNYQIKSLFHLIRQEQNGYKFEVLPDNGKGDLELYNKHLKSERKEYNATAKAWIWKQHGENHYLDATCMNVLFAKMHELI